MWDKKMIEKCVDNIRNPVCINKVWIRYNPNKQGMFLATEQNFE